MPMVRNDEEVLQLLLQYQYSSSQLVECLQRTNTCIRPTYSFIGDYRKVTRPYLHGYSSICMVLNYKNESALVVVLVHTGQLKNEVHQSAPAMTQLLNTVACIAIVKSSSRRSPQTKNAFP